MSGSKDVAILNRNCFYAEVEIFYLLKPVSRTEPEPEPQTGKNRFISVNPNRT